MCKHRIKRFLEPIGLFLVLAAFGWQCLQEHSYHSRIDGYFYEMNEKLLHIWGGVYDEALRSDRYNGQASFWKNYDEAYSSMKDWQQMQKEMRIVDSQSSWFLRIRVALYVLGSLFVIIGKWPEVDKEDKLRQ